MPDEPSQAAFDPLFALRIDRRAETEFFPDNLCGFLWLLAFGIETSLALPTLYPRARPRTCFHLPTGLALV